MAHSSCTRAERSGAVRLVLYGRNPVREAVRGRRRVLRAWATDRAAREPWLAGLSVELAEADEIETRCGSPDHQGLCAEAEPYPYVEARSLLAAEDGVIVCLDQVQDPANLGAVCRTAECAGAAGVVTPIGARRRSPRPSAAPRRARSSTCR